MSKIVGCQKGGKFGTVYKKSGYAQNRGKDSMAGVQLEHVVREYVMGKTTIRAVDDISFTIPEGKYTIILGASGAGKSTVLNILGGMDSPTSGLVSVNGKEISSFNKRQLTG